MSSKSQNARMSVFGLRLPMFHFEKESQDESEGKLGPEAEVTSLGSTTSSELSAKTERPATPRSETGSGRSGSSISGDTTTDTRHCCSHSRFPSQPQNKPIHRKPVPSKTYIPYTPPNNTTAAPTTTTNTTTIENTNSTGPSKPPNRQVSNDRNYVSPSQFVVSFAPSSPPAVEHLHNILGSPFKPKKAPTMPVSKPPPQQAIPAIYSHLASPPLGVPNVMTTAATPASETKKLQRNRSPSPEGPPSAAKLRPNRPHPRHQSPGTPRGRSVSAQPPIGGPRGLSVDASRAVSNPLEFRADSRQPSEGGGGNSSPTDGAAETKKKVRKSWLPGARSRSNSSDLVKPKGTGAWIMSPDSQVDYNVAPLFTGDKVPELWNEQGNVLVYLHPKERGLGPSFRVHDYVFSPSLILNELLVQEMMASASMSSDFLGVDDAERRQQWPGLQPRNSGGGLVADGHLYLPLGNNEVDCLVAARNLFAFLTNQPLVGTHQHPTLFSALIQISEHLRQFQFTNYDGTSYGVSVDASFDMLLDQFHIADVRHSREKTIEGLVLGEHMKSWNLYNEAFSHAVGKYESLLELKLPLYNSISVITRERLERAHLSLANRQANVQGRLENFEYPSLFAGTASSTSNPDYRIVRFKEWRAAFSRMRTFVLGYYKDLFGSWPPKARSKKNHFTHSGLNRQCLKMLYSDLCALYDLLVDRQSITPRVIDQDYYGADSGKTSEGKEDKNKPTMDLIPACISALRQMLSEFEKSSPPVLPPIPFDVPKIPTMTAIYETYDNLPDKKKAKFDKGLQPHELQLIMIKSRNMDTDTLPMPFLQAYKEFELKEAKGVHPHDLIDHRIGHWLFLYVTLQSLPMLVVDAPGLHYTEGVEYFLCEAPQGNPPWRAEDVGEVRKMWYQTADQKTVELSADVVLFSVEGVYMRSHCWLAGKEWETANASESNGLAVPGATGAPGQGGGGGGIGVAFGGGEDGMGLPFASPLHPPRAVFADMDPVAGGGGHSRRDSDGSVGRGSMTTPNSPQIRARSGSPAHRARHAYRASIAMGLEPLPLVGSDAPPIPGDRTSRAPSHGSGSSSPGFNGVYGQGGLRASRSAVNLSGQQGQQWHVGDTHMGMGSRKSSYGGAGGPLAPPPAIPAAGHGHSREGSQGGSTFDDILKGMDTGKKKKKSLFF
ncbi:hypothetical protein QBC36DRAFT_380478 [Triangularia setosa]|uniref:DUF8004 domain-containing protein n=1 Tax=Triangularia setosa TaxID=2587417 RepID=A0AAN6W4G7_9PEZI|nr:hypothetical protein QBC36DRAFT_380478 [Podospora setosa]